jgi:hypothetical protein
LDSREVVYKYRLSKWTAIIRECRSSGQTVAVWCSEHNINQKTYYYWLKRVRDAACEALPALNADNNSIVPDPRNCVRTSILKGWYPNVGSSKTGVLNS